MGFRRTRLNAMECLGRFVAFDMENGGGCGVLVGSLAPQLHGLLPTRKRPDLGPPKSRKTALNEGKMHSIKVPGHVPDGWAADTTANT